MTPPLLKTKTYMPTVQPALVGLASALAGGCPARQLVLTGEGDGSATAFALGMTAGAALTHNFALAKPCVEGAMEVTISPAGMIAVVLGLVVCLLFGFGMRERETPPPSGG